MVGMSGSKKIVRVACGSGALLGALLIAHSALAAPIAGAKMRSGSHGHGLSRVLRPAEVDQSVLEQFRPDHRYWRQSQSVRVGEFVGDDPHAQFRPVLPIEHSSLRNQ